MTPFYSEIGGAQSVVVCVNYLLSIEKKIKRLMCKKRTFVLIVVECLRLWLWNFLYCNFVSTSQAIPSLWSRFILDVYTDLLVQNTERLWQEKAVLVYRKGVFCRSCELWDFQVTFLQLYKRWIQYKMFIKVFYRTFVRGIHYLFQPPYL